MMREQKSKTSYATLAEFIAAAKLNPNPAPQSRSFAYVETLGEALELAEKGWEEGTRKIQALSLPIINKVTSLIEVPHIEYDTTGLDFDMGRYIDGAECWYNFYSTMEQGQGFKHVRVIVNFAVSGGVAARVIESRGAIAAALVIALESTGIRVTLDAVCAVDGGNELWVNLKQADQNLDIDRLAFALVHPAFLRHLLLAVKPEWGMRVPRDIPAEEQKDIYIGKGHLLETQWANPETASSWIIEQLKTQGVQFNSEIRPAA